MKKLFKISVSFLLILGLVGCAESGDEGTASSLTVETQKSTLSELKDEMGIDFSVKSNYGSEVEVSLNDLGISVTPCIVEQVIFSPSEIILNENIEQENVHAVVRFAEACTPTAYTLSGTSLLSLDGRTNEIEFGSGLQEVSPEENQTVVTTPISPVTPIDNNTTTENNDTNESSVDTINYAIKFSLEDEEVMKFNLEDKKSFKIALIDKDTNNYIADSQIIKIIVTSKQPNLLKLFDADLNSIPTSTLIYEKKNYSTLYVQTYTRSGLADIDVMIEYLNTKGNPETLQKTYSTMVLSGPPTAFSINSAGVSYNFETKWFENKFLVSAVDKYNNVVNISPTIYASAMTGFTRDSNGKEVLYGNFGDVKGKLNVDKESAIATFEANSTVFDNIDVNRDYLYVFGAIDDYEALGKWDIDVYDNNETTLLLSEDFNGENHDGLGFVLGHNYLNDVGSSESSEWQVKIDSSDGKYQLDSEGKAFVTLKFPTYLVGKRTALAINFLGKTPETGKILRSGEVKFKTLASFEGIHSPDPITIEKDTVGAVYASRYFYINTGTGDKWAVLNSHVRCNIKTSNVSVVVGSERENTIVSTVEEFKANGNSYHAYVGLKLSLIDTTKAGSYSFSECQVRTLPLF